MSPDQGNRNQHCQKHIDPRNFPTTPVDGGTKHAAADERRAATTTKATRKDRIFSSVLKNHDTRRFPSSPDWDSQMTLTQLVPTAEAGEYSEDENRLKAGTNQTEVIDLLDDDDAEEYNPSYRSSNRRPPFREHSNTSFRSLNNIPTTTFKRRKSSGITPSSSLKSTKLARGKNEKNLKFKGKNRNKTLTQMDFVRRYIPLPESDDDDLKLYDEMLPAANENDKMDDEDKYKDDLLTPRKRRKLDDENTLAPPIMKTKSSPDQKPEEHLLSGITPTPKTPQRTRKFEIPSSQTPESPYMKFSPSPNLRKIRPPMLVVQSNTAERNQRQVSEGRSTNSKIVRLRYKPTALQNLDILDEEFPASTATPSSQVLQQATVIKPLVSEPVALNPNLRSPEPPPVPLKERTVVYDTDADTDYGDIDDDNLPQPSNETNIPISLSDQTDCLSRHRNTQSAFDSDDLPPIPNSGTDLEIHANTLSDSALASESSVYYRRPAQCTQYPNEPVPMMNTQKIAELFPIEEEEREEGANGSRSFRVEATISSPGQTAISSDNQHREIPCSQDEETPTQGEIYVDRSIQMVPESSPLTRHDEIRSTANTMAPPARDSIVLVESSQLVDRISRQNESINAGASLRRLFSTGQFLTDSVMESIPAPPWALSQDSVGEPYPDDDGD